MPGEAALRILAVHRHILRAPEYTAFWDGIFRQSDGKQLAAAALGLLQTRWPRQLWFSFVGLDTYMAVDLAVLMFITPDPWVQKELYDLLVNAIPQSVEWANFPELQPPQWPLARHWLRVGVGETGEMIWSMAVLCGQLDPEAIRHACLAVLPAKLETP